MMRALVKSRTEPGLWMEHVPIPKPGPSEVLIKIHKTGICGTDLHIYNWDDWAQRNIRTPRILGHEFAGEIAELGANVTGYQVGDRVSGEGHITCGNCRNCRTGLRHLCHRTTGIGGGRDGAFAEYMTLPAENLWRLHPDISTEIAAILDPFGNAVYCALSFDVASEDVLITGAGPIGIMAAAVCRTIGARHVVITDVNDDRLALAAKLGATRTINVQRESIADAMRAMNMSNGFDVGLEMSGNPRAFSDMIEAMYNGGKIALLGFLPPSTQINWDRFIFKGLTLKGIYGREIFTTWYKMTHLIRSGLDLTPIITHRFPAARFIEGFEAMRQSSCGKVVLDWS